MAIIKPSQLASGSYNITGSLHGTSSYAVTASYVVGGSGITIGSTPLTSGTSTRILYQSGSVIQQDAGFLFDPANKTVTNYGKGAINTNISIGENQFESITSGYLNTAISKFSLQSLTSGYENVGLGYLTLNSLTSGYDNTALGYQALRLMTTGTANTAVGAFALQLNTSAFGYNTAVGYASLQDNTGQYNTAMGYWAGKGTTTGQYNTFIGFGASGITTGNNNTIIGYQSLSLPTASSNNIIITDGAGNIGLRKDSNNYVGIGWDATGSLGAKLDIKAAGALSTDIALRVRNSADTENGFQYNGDGTYRLGGLGGDTYTKAFSHISDGRIFMSQTGVNFIELNPGTTQHRFYFPSNGVEINTDAKPSSFAMSNSTQYTFYQGGVQYGNSIFAVSGTPTRYFLIQNGTSPSENFPDRHWYYSADQAAGNAAPHFRTENGSIIKLYKEIQPALSGSANTGDPATDALIEAMKTIILNLGFGSSS
jgi:hypothetical protein